MQEVRIVNPAHHNIQVGLVLGGGGARGIAHVGILKVFEDEHIPISLIVGSSVGALIGATYALHPNARDLVNKVQRVISEHGLFKLENFFVKSNKDDTSESRMHKVANFLHEIYVMRFKNTRSSFVDASMMNGLIQELVGDATFEDLKIPFVAMTTDMLSGEHVVLGHGPLKPAILASTAIPGAFPMVEWHGRLLADGSLVLPMPARIAKEMGMDMVIAIDVGRDVIKKKLNNITEVCVQAETITSNELRRLNLKEADIVIEPNVRHISWAHFSKSRSCSKKGIEAAHKAIPKIKIAMAKIERQKV